MPLKQTFDWQGQPVWVFVARGRPSIAGLSESSEGTWILYEDNTTEPADWIAETARLYMTAPAQAEFIARRDG